MGLRRLKRVTAAAGILLAVGAVSFAVLDRLYPPNLSRLNDLSVQVVDRNGDLLRAYTTKDDTWRVAMTEAEASPIYLKMLVAYEDSRFAMHPGVDPFAILRAAWQWAKAGSVVSGASTLTMQAARLLEPRPRTLRAKAVEMFRAVQLELHYSKAEILGIYLTLAPMGGNLEGVRAASLAYFGKEPRHLTPGEAALLVAVPQSPTRNRPDRANETAKAARDKVLALMLEKRVLTAQQIADAVAEPVPSQRRALPILAPHLADRMLAASTGQRVVRTSVDRTLQANLEKFVKAEHSRLGERATVAVLVIDNATREVRAYLGSSDFFDDARNGQIDMTRAIRSPGSTLKPFIYALGFDDRLILPDTLIVDAPMRFGDYAPENFYRTYHGEITVREALQQSLNVPAVAIFDAVGPARFVGHLRDAGVRLALDNVAQPGLPIALGGVGVTMFDLATLFASLSRDGVVKPLRLSPDQDQAEPDATNPGTRIMSSAAAWYLARILENAPPPEDFVAGARIAGARKLAYKTGTSYGFRDAWAIGYDNAYTVAVWVGRPDGTPSPGHYGRNTAAPLLFRMFDLLPETNLSGPAMPARPAHVIDAPNAQLPANLRRFERPGRIQLKLAAATVGELAISFPPDGALVELARDGDGKASLAMTAEGGIKPLRWLVNGRPLDASPHRRQAFWTPDGDGFVKITVIDAEGRSASADVRLTLE
ncbi:MAG: penicillin-binding protein 1C [Alphaproteobacteria bacterium]